MVLTLHDVPGPYPVGATTFVVPIDLDNPDDRVLSDATVKSTAAGRPDEPALKLEEVAFTAFYPANLDGLKHPTKGLSWIPRWVVCHLLNVEYPRVD